MPKLTLRMGRAEVQAALADYADPRVKAYRAHNCERVHRTYTAMSRCLWPNGVLEGSETGPYALVWWFDQWPTITLHDTADDALAKLTDTERQLEWMGEGHLNNRHHKVVRLILPTTAK